MTSLDDHPRRLKRLTARLPKPSPASKDPNLQLIKIEITTAAYRIIQAEIEVDQNYCGPASLLARQQPFFVLHQAKVYNQEGELLLSEPHMAVASSLVVAIRELS